MKAVEITTPEDLKTWILALPSAKQLKAARLLAFRSVYRVFPLAFDPVATLPPNEVVASPLIRCGIELLLGAVDEKRRPPHLLQSADFHKRIANQYAIDFPSFSSLMAALLNAISVLSTDYASHAAADAKATLQHSADSLRERGLKDFISKYTVDDAVILELGGDPIPLTLWPDGAEPLAEEWNTSFHLRESHSGWSVFTDLYENALHGRPQNWPLLIELAEKDEDFWTGPDNEVLDRIAGVLDEFERRRLLEETRRLQAELAALKSMRTASATTRSHNNPPELIDDDFIAEKFSEIEPDLKAVAEELDTRRPDRTRLKPIARRLSTAVGAIIMYCAKLADTFLTSATKTLGAAAPAYGADLFFNDGRFATYVSDLIRFAFGG